MDRITVVNPGAAKVETHFIRHDIFGIRLVEAVRGRDHPVTVDEAPAAEAGGTVIVDEDETHHPGELALQGWPATNDTVRSARAASPLIACRMEDNRKCKGRIVGIWFR